MGKLTWVFFVVLLFLTGCSQQDEVHDPLALHRAVLSGEMLFIPDVYLDFKYTSAGDESALIQMWYPGSNPVPGDPQELWRQGEWYQNVRLLLTNNKTIRNGANILQGQIDLQSADLLVGNEYGLAHYAQSDPHYAIFKDDLYIEDRENGSYIRCTKKQTADDPVSLCKHKFGIGKMSFSITYDKRLLPDWKIIKTNVVAMYESFKAPDTARAYIQQFYPDNEIQGG